MSDLELRLRLTATDDGLKAAVVDAHGRIDALGRGSQRAGERTRRGMNQARAGVERLNRSLDATKRLLVGFVSIQFARGLAGQLASAADSAANLAARLRLVTDSQDEFNQVQAELFRIAQRTRAPLEATADLYARMGPALKRITGSTGEALQVVETINQALATSGATAAESSGALLQLSQALAAGALRGDEFNSVMEGAPGIMRAIADGLGVPISKLRELANAGRLTAEVVVGALQKSRDSVSQAFSEMPLTIGGALQQVENRFLQLVGQMDNASGASRRVAEAIVSAADYMDEALQGVVFAANAVAGAIRGIAGAASLAIAGVLDLIDTLTLGLSDTLGNLVESFRAAAEVNFQGLAADLDAANAAFRRMTTGADANADATRRAAEQVAGLEERVRSASATAATSELLPKVDAGKLSEFENGLRRQAAAYRAVALALRLGQEDLQRTAGLVEQENAAYRIRLSNLRAFWQAGLIDRETYQVQVERAARDHQQRLAQIEKQGAALRQENERYAQRLALIEAAYRREELSAAEHQARLAQLEAEHQQRIAEIRAQYRQADQAAYQQYLAGLIAQAEQAYQIRLQALRLALDQGLVSEAEYRSRVEELERRHVADLAQIRQNALQQYLQQLDRQAQAAEQTAGLRRQVAEQTAQVEIEAAVRAGQGVSDAAAQAADNVQQAFAQAAQGAGQALISIAQTAEDAFAQVQVNMGQAVAVAQSGVQQVGAAPSQGQGPMDSLFGYLSLSNPIGQIISKPLKLPDGTELATDPRKLMLGGEQAILDWINAWNALTDNIHDNKQPPRLSQILPFGPGWDLLQQYLHQSLPVSIISGGTEIGKVDLTSAEIDRLLQFSDALDRARKIQQELNRVAEKYPADIARKISASLQRELDGLIKRFPDIKKALQNTLGGKIELPKIELPKIGGDVCPCGNDDPLKAQIDKIKNKYLPNAAGLWEKGAKKRLDVETRTARGIDRLRSGELRRERRGVDRLTETWSDHFDALRTTAADTFDDMAARFRQAVDDMIAAAERLAESLSATFATVQFPTPSGDRTPPAASPPPRTGTGGFTWLDTAPRYHSGGVAGLKPDEVPAILQKGELILTPQQARMLAPAGRSRVEIHIHNHAGVAVDARESATPDGGRRIDLRLLAEAVESVIADRVAEGRGLARLRNPYALGGVT